MAEVAEKETKAAKPKKLFNVGISPIEIPTAFGPEGFRTKFVEVLPGQEVTVPIPADVKAFLFKTGSLKEE